MMRDFKTGGTYSNTNENNNSSKHTRSASSDSDDAHSSKVSSATTWVHGATSNTVTSHAEHAHRAGMACDSPSAVDYYNITENGSLASSTNSMGVVASHPSSLHSLATTTPHTEDNTNTDTVPPNNANTKSKRKSSNKNKLVSDE